MAKPVKTIWLVNRYAMPPQYESRLRTIKFAHYLREAGYDVTVFGASEMHNMDVNLITDGSKYIVRDYGDIHFVHIKTLNYNHKGSIVRTLSDILFHYRLVKISHEFSQPDLILATTYALISDPVLSWAHRIGAKYITDTLDMWPDVFADLGLMSSSNPLFKYLIRVAKHRYEKSDACSFSLTECKKYIVNKKWDIGNGGKIDLEKVFYINNGVDLSDFNQWCKTNTLEDQDLLNDKKHIIYMGSIRLANGLMMAIKAAELLKDRTDVDFLIYGDGGDRDGLIVYCHEHGLGNVIFKSKWTDPKYVPFILSHSYLNLLNYASSGFAKYGISSSKLFQYMAAGHPIVCNINLPSCPIAHYNIGTAKEFNSSEEYAQAIETMLDLDKESYNAMCERAREAAKDFDYPYLTQKQIDIIKWLENK